VAVTVDAPFDGYVARIRATPGELALSWEQLTRIDTTTLGTLAASLAASLDVLDEEQRSVHRDELRKSMTLIPGGA
jgi:hypothetical protein